MKTLFTIGMLCLSVGVNAQENSGNTADTISAPTVTVASVPSVAVVQPARRSVNGEVRQGVTALVDASKKDVRKAWKSYLRTYGKVVAKGDKYMITDARIPVVSSTPLQLNSMVSHAGAGSTEVFLALDEADAAIGPESAGYEATQEFLRNFVVQTYQQRETKNVSKAQKELKSAQRQANSVTNKQERLSKKLEQAKKDQQKYERKAVESQQQQVKLSQQMTDTTQKQTEAMQKLERARTQLETRQMKLNEIK